ncbi:MAG: selenium cofactor biosynthesis protein YqeC [Thermodesulfobacteriota bacterium]|nr:selenium cofactor biosynthesis protein YqeC [Thermodesulfobacteriota bacterium]
MEKDLISALGLGPKEHVAIVGGGGKTTMMFALAQELSSQGYKVVTTTTTKVWHSQASRHPCVILSSSDTALHEEVRKALREVGHVFVGRSILDSGKVDGISPLSADAFSHAPWVDYLILEADGAAGRPLKAPAEYEPVIPSSASVVIAVMGLEALGRRLEPEVTFRSERFTEVTGLEPGAILTPECIERVFQSSEGLFKGTPGSARRVAFLNKVDLLSDRQGAGRLADLLLLSPNSLIERVVTGSIIDNIYSTIRKQK